MEKNSTRLSVARVLDSVIFFSLLLTIALTAIPYGTVQPWWVALFECFVFVLAILALIQGFISKGLRVDGLSLAMPLALLVLFALFQSLPLFSATANESWPGLRLSLSADPYTTRLFAVRLFALIVAGLLLLRYTNSRSRLRTLIYVVIGIGVASALFGIVREDLQQGPGFVLPALNNNGRGFAQFINRDHFGFLMEMALGLTLGLLIGVRGRARFLVFLPLAAFLLVALIVSNSRGAILASLCQLLFLGLVFDPSRHFTRQTGKTWSRLQNLAGGLAVRVILVVCLIVFFAYGVSWVGGERVVTNFKLVATGYDQPGLDPRENTNRKQIWSATWRLIKAHPIAGVGFGGYWIGITKYHDASGEFTPQEAHNDYLELLASGGLIGVALALWFIVAFLRKARHGARSGDAFCRAACLGALTGIFGVAVHSVVDFGLHLIINSLILCVLIVVAAHSSTLEAQSQELAPAPR